MLNILTLFVAESSKRHHVKRFLSHLFIYFLFQTIYLYFFALRIFSLIYIFFLFGSVKQFSFLSRFMPTFKLVKRHIPRGIYCEFNLGNKKIVAHLYTFNLIHSTLSLYSCFIFYVFVFPLREKEVKTTTVILI